MNYFLQSLISVGASVAAILLAQKFYPGSVWAALAAIVAASLLTGLLLKYTSAAKPGVMSTGENIGLFVVRLAPFILLVREFNFLTAMGISIAGAVISLVFIML